MLSCDNCRRLKLPFENQTLDYLIFFHLLMSWLLDLKKCTFDRTHYVLFYEGLGKVKQLIA